MYYSFDIELIFLLVVVQLVGYHLAVLVNIIVKIRFCADKDYRNALPELGDCTDIVQGILCKSFLLTIDAKPNGMYDCCIYRSVRTLCTVK